MRIKRYGREGNEIMILKELSPEAEREKAKKWQTCVKQSDLKQEKKA